MLRALPGLAVTLAMALVFSWVPVKTPESGAARSARSAGKKPGAAPGAKAERTDSRPVATNPAPPSSVPGGCPVAKPGLYTPGHEAATSTALAVPAAVAARSRSVAKPSRPSGAAGSGAALASLAMASHYPPPPATSSPDLPDKGMYVWGEAILFSSREDGDTLNEPARYDGKYLEYPNSGYGKYDHDGQIYRLGVKKDWTIDTILGLSADLLDSEVKSRQPGDYRKNSITGLVANAHYDGVLLDRFPVSARLFYGRTRTDGDGSYLGSAGGVPTSRPWREERYSSDLYGFAARIGQPLLCGDDIKILPEFGVEYTVLNSDSHLAWGTAAQTDSVTVPDRRSYSLAFPFSVQARRDFYRCWGMFTPRLELGFVYEAGDSAGGVRSLNAAAATRLYVENGVARGLGYGCSPDRLYGRFGLGFDLRSNGGWQVKVEYGGLLSGDYLNQKIGMELGKCF